MTLRRALLALLVIADQRCPAIIGQAHLLYHAAVDPESTREAVAELKRDTAELVQAIADVEAASVPRCSRG
jgi:hypothetical protein